ncbi:hypothetical protein GSI_01298 [Ganoderma sinense ZZ0214-1]|uniref:RNase H type-1 domain-containing protein n=1 Tax=Ganoderma sinense ZZ0214-1 TaxID=1077348 RepID=A0A2G8SV21_9APHY|nr:hypothetical protein GSI_01298 [Ganoderma sinense ZZ0214-1]
MPERQNNGASVNPPLQHLRIWQQNVNRSITAQYDLLHSADPRDYDILAIQEPYIDHLRLTRASSRWTVVYPDGHLDSELPCRSVLLVNTAISSNAWRPLNIPSLDVSAIALTAGGRTIYLFNLYVDGSHDRALHAAARATRRLDSMQGERAGSDSLIWLGDFNRHNPAWDEPRNHHLFTPLALDRSQRLLNYLADFDLEMSLPAGVPTLEVLSTRNLTRPDNVFCSADLSDLLMGCTTAPQLRPTKTDHFPILTTLDISLAPARPPRRRNFREVDWEGFERVLRAHLDAHPIAPNIHSIADFDAHLQRLNEAIAAAVEQEVPLTNPTPFSRRWWSKDLTSLRKQKQRAGRASFKHRHDHAHPAHEDYRRIRNQYAEHIKYARKDCWTSFLDDTDAHSIWTAHRFLKRGQSDGGAAWIPSLKSIADPTCILTDNAAKGEEFYGTFFLPPGPDPPPTQEHEYPEPRFTFTDISDLQVTRAIAALRAFKAPGPDGVPNEVYIHCRDTLTPLLGTLFRATFQLQYYPDTWKLSDTIVLRKPGKTDYTTAKAHRPIALLNCMSKILSRCVADVLVYQAETHSLLADYQFGGRAGRTTTDSIHLVTKTVKDAWRQGKVASVLFLDIKSAFPAATPERLFHNMRLLGVPSTITDWLRRKLSGRRTRLKFDDYESDPFDIHSGIDQGCPLSVILYGFFNTLLINSASIKKGELAVGSMDDVALITVGRTFADTHSKLQDFFNRPGGASEWSATHNSHFSLDKFGLLNMTRKASDALGPHLCLGDTTIEPSSHHRFLGVLVDHRLRFHQHIAAALGKGMIWVTALRRLARSQYGLAPALIRRLYLAVAIPSMLYAVDTFISPISKPDGARRCRGSVGAVRKLGRVHREAVILITGAMRTTATDIMTAHADVLPLPLIIDKLCHRATVRLCTLAPPHPLVPHIRRAAARYVKRHRSQLHELLNAYVSPDTPVRMEKLRPARYHPDSTPAATALTYDDKDTALDADEQWMREHRVSVYTDGSEKDDMVGASAVLVRRDKPHRRTLRYHLGPSSEYGIYEAEIVGAIMGTELLRTEREAVGGPSVALDNKSSIEASQQISTRPSHYLTDYLLQRADVLRTRGVFEGVDHPQLTLRWVPGHTGVKGNEFADLEAKRAAQGASQNSSHRRLPRLLRKPLPISAAKVKLAFAKSLEEKATKAWRDSIRGRRFLSIDPALPSPKYMKAIKSLSRRQAAVLFQLRSGHAPLNAHLHRISRAPAASCPACTGAPETVLHYLLVCPAYANVRSHYLSGMGRRSRDLSALLGTPDAWPPLLRYVGATRRLAHTFGDVAPQRGQRDDRQQAPQDPRRRRRAPR